MYKKNKATKNNSLKKASISTAVAALASVAALSGVEPFKPDSASMTFAATGYLRSLLRNYDGFGPYGGGLWASLYGKDGTDRLTENQRENLDLDKKIVERLCSSVGTYLSEQGLRSKLSGFGVSSAVYEGTIKEMTEKNKSYKKLAESFGNVRASVGQRSFMNAAAADLLASLEQYKSDSIRIFVEMLNAINISRSSDSEAVKQMQGIAKEFKSTSELVRLSNIGAILDNEDKNVRREARRICEKAVLLLFEGKTFSDLAVDKHFKIMSSRYSRFDESDWKLVGKMSDSVKPLYAVLDALLGIIQAVDDVVRELVAQQAILSIRKYMVKMVERGESEMAAAYARKEQMGTVAAVIGSDAEQTLLTPLLLADDTVDKKNMKIDGFSWFGNNGVSSLRDDLVGALYGERNLTRVLDKYLDDVKSDTYTYGEASNKRQFSYDLATLMVNVFGDEFARECFSWLESMNSDLFGKVYDKLFGASSMTDAERQQRDTLLKQKFRLKDSDIQNIRAAKAEFDSNGNSRFHYVGKSGEVLPFPIEFTQLRAADGRVLADGRLSGRGARTVAVYSMMPNLLKYSGLLAVMKDLYERRATTTVNPTEYENTIEPLFNEDKFLAGARSAVSAVSTIFEKVSGLIDRLAKVKDSAKSRASKKKAAKVVDEDVRCVLPLDEGNVITDKYKFEFEGNTLKFSNLPDGIKQVSVVVCPKNSADGKKTGNKDFDGPVVDVRNGVATFDYASLFTPGAGSYELHFRNEVKDDKGNVIDHKFLCKVKLVYKMGETVHTSSVQEGTIKQDASESTIDLSSSEIFLNQDESFTIKAKTGNGSNLPKNLTVVFFAAGAPANLESDMFAAELIDGKYETKTPPRKGNTGWQAHIYGPGKTLSKENFIGKLEFDSSKAKEIKIQNAGSLVDVVSKEGFKGNNSKVTKKLKITLPKEGFSDDSGISRTSLPYDVVYSDNYNSKAFSSAMSLEYVGESADGTSEIYNADVEIAATKADQKIVLTNDDGDKIVGDNSVNSETEVNAKINFANGTKLRNSNGFGNNLGMGMYYNNSNNLLRKLYKNGLGSLGNSWWTL